MADVNSIAQALTLHHPLPTLRLAIATGMAIGHEMSRRGAKDELDTLSTSTQLCDKACDAVLLLWHNNRQAGGITEQQFDDLVEQITRIARSS